MFEEKVDCKESEKRLKNNPKVGINLSNIKPWKGKEKGKTNWCKNHSSNNNLTDCTTGWNSFLWSLFIISKTILRYQWNIRGAVSKEVPW